MHLSIGTATSTRCSLEKVHCANAIIVAVYHLSFIKPHSLFYKIALCLIDVLTHKP